MIHFSISAAASATIERNGVKLGGEELVRVVVRQATFDKIAHKLDRMGDYQPEIIYENAELRELDPTDDRAMTKVNASAVPLFVTVSDDVDAPA